MYIYHVENVRAGQGGRLYLEIPQNGPFWPETQLNPPDQLPITFFWYESKLFKSVHNVQQLQGNKKELNNHDAMCSWGSEEQKNIKKSSRKWDFFRFWPLAALYIYIYIYIYKYIYIYILKMIWATRLSSLTLKLAIFFKSSAQLGSLFNLYSAFYIIEEIILKYSEAT